MQRGQFWDVVLNRQYTTPQAQWDPVHRFSMFVRKDVAAQVWDWGAPAAAAAGDGAAAVGNPYEGGQRIIEATQQIGQVGAPGNAAGQFNFPRAVAVDDKGQIYVADSGNNRIQVFNPDGTFLRQWGSTCKLDTREGCVGGGEGQFNEPWGIAVGQDGSVYVSDTWNHRVQKFTNDGQFVKAWGVFGSTGGELGQENLFYGPRSLAIGRDGNLYAMDTGNKRVQVFSPNGDFISQFGGGGVVDGRLDEPVGLGQDADGNWYVTDTWNKRIQKFDEAGQYVAQWPVTGWDTHLLIVAFLSRTIGLGDRAMSHDESLHTVYSWQLFDGRGYQHQPMMHGPLKFILNPVMYFLFGVNDWSARILVALFGVAMVAFVWMMRRWLGRTGAFITALIYTISPALLYHSRYIRDEVMLTALLVFLVIAMFRYLETRSTQWLVWNAVALGFAFLTMEASFIFGGLFGIFLLLAFAAQLWASVWPGDDAGPRRQSFRILVAIALPLMAVGLALVIFKVKLVGLAALGTGLVLALLAVILAVVRWRSKLRAFAELDLIVLFLTLVLPFLSAIILKAMGWQISQFNNPGQITLSLVWQGLAVLAVLFIASVVIGFLWLRQRWLIAAGIFWAIELLFFTTFLTNGQGIGTGLIGSLGYWIDQQEVMRGGQPWYYFYMLVPLYEFLPLVLFIGGLVAWIASLFGRQGNKETGKQVDGETSRQGSRGARGAEGYRRAESRAEGGLAESPRSPCRPVGSPRARAQRPAHLRGVHRLLAAGHLGGVHLRRREDGVAHGLLRRFDGAAGRLVAGQSLRRDQLGRGPQTRHLLADGDDTAVPDRAEGAAADLGAAAVFRHDGQRTQ